MTDVATAPFTDDQVASLNACQQTGQWHPYTCENRGDGKHRYTRDLGVLVATNAGWVCPDCDYTQSWAHPWSANWRWRNLREFDDDPDL